MKRTIELSKQENDLCYNTKIMSQEKLKVLLVEDEEDAVSSITKFLERKEFRVTSTGSGQEAVEIAKSSYHDIVLLDLSLKDITGIEVLEEIRKFNPTLKIIMVTGSILMTEDRQRVSALGVHRFITKPSTAEELLDGIYETLNSDDYLTLSEFPVWQYEPGRGISSRHELKCILGSLNMQCANFLSDIDNGRMDSLDDGKKFIRVVEEVKEIHGKIKKACEAVNKEIIP